MEISKEDKELEIMSEKKGLIFNIQRFSLHDGPGIRTTIFLKGCPLNCLWCHNPEGINHSKEILYKSFSCILCGTCVTSCPRNVLHLDEDQILIERDQCNLCGICAEICQTNSLKLCGIEISVEDLIKEVLADREFYLTSNGGITISGGEPLMQFSYLKKLIKALKDYDLHVCLDTGGFVENDKFKQILDLIDMVLFDVKTLNTERHKRLTGVSNELILKNMKECLNYDIDIIIRTPVIIGYNFIDIEDELREHLIDLMEIGFKSFELIPYHNFGEQKYQMLGLNYQVKIDSNQYNLIKELADKLKKEYDINIKLSQPILT